MSSCSNTAKCGNSSHLMTPIGPTTFCADPEAEAGEPEKTCCTTKLIPWERLISATPADARDSVIKFFVAKHAFKLVRVSGEVQTKAITAEIRINETFFTSLTIDTAASKKNFHATKTVEKEVAAGDLVEVYIPDFDLASGDPAPANLEIELQGEVEC